MSAGARAGSVFRIRGASAVVVGLGGGRIAAIRSVWAAIGSPSKTTTWELHAKRQAAQSRAEQDNNTFASMRACFACLVVVGARAGVRDDIDRAYARNDPMAVALLSADAIDSYGEDGRRPSFHHYLGWAHFSRHDLPAARDAFLGAVRHDPADARSWLHLGATLLSAFQVNGARPGRSSRSLLDASRGRRGDGSRGPAAGRDVDMPRG